MSAPNQQSETIQSKAPSRTGWYAAIAVVVIVIIIFAGLYAAGYIGKSTKTPSKSTVPACTSFTITAAGSTFVEQLMDEWALKYTVNPLDYDPVGSGAGISSITDKTIAYGASDAPLNATQQAAAPGLLTMPETAGAVAVIFNLPGVSFHLGDSLNLTGAILAQIYLGTISWWNNTAITSINPGVSLPTAQISVWHRSDGSGTSYAFTQFLSDSSATWKTDVGYATLPPWPATPVGGGAKGSSGIAGEVEETADSLGYVDLGYAFDNQIHYAAVQNPSSNYIVPTANNTASAIADILATTTLPAGTASWSGVSMINAPGAKDYPIATFSYMLYYENAGSNSVIASAADASALGNFLNWTVTAGQAYSGQFLYIPLPTAVVTADQTTIALMNYNGAAIAPCS
jgi:phosphate transport system substrate-binding protein